MRKSNISSKDALAAELAAAKRKETRATGFAKMHERDKGYHRLSNGVSILWPTTREPVELEALRQVPEGKFVLVVDGKDYLFDTDEFRQQLRWA